VENGKTSIKRVRRSRLGFSIFRYSRLIMISCFVIISLFLFTAAFRPSLNEGEYKCCSPYDIPPLQMDSARAENYSFSVIPEDSKYTYYMSPLEEISIKVNITNTGLCNDSYRSFISFFPGYWDHDVSGSITPALSYMEFHEIILNITAPSDLWHYSNEMEFIINISSLENNSIREELKLFFFLSPIEIDFDSQISDLEGQIQTEKDVLMNRNELIFIEIENKGNLRDIYDIRISGLSEGWDAYFSPGMKYISADLPSSLEDGNMISIPLIVRCGENGTEENNLQVIINSTVTTITGDPTISEVQSINLIKTRNQENIFLSVSQQYFSVLPGETIEVEIQATNGGETTVVYTPSLIFTLPQWLEMLDGPDEDAMINPGSTIEYEYELLVNNDTLADNASPIGFTGTDGEGRFSFYETWIYVNVGTYHNLTAVVSDTNVEVSTVSGDTINITLENLGNGEEMVSLYLNVNDLERFADISLEPRKVSLQPGETAVSMLNISLLEKVSFNYSNIIIFIETSEQSLSYDIGVSIKRDDDGGNEKLEDLYLFDVELSKSLDGLELVDRLFVNFSISNQINLGGEPFEISVKTLNPLGSVSQIILEKEINGLGPGDVRYFSVPIILKKTDALLSIRLDPDNLIDEVNESNNIWESEMHVDDDGDAYVSYSGGNDSSVPMPVYVLGGGFAALGAVIGLLYGFGGESTRYSLMGIVTPLYSRLSRDEVLSHDIREQVYHYVRDNPGEHYRSIKKNLSLKNGTLMHHLHTLENKELIVSKKDGPYRRFFPPGSREKRKIYLTGLRQRLYMYIQDNPGLSQKEISQALEQKPPTVNYHIQILADMGLVEIKKNGRGTRCYPNISESEN